MQKCNNTQEKKNLKSSTSPVSLIPKFFTSTCLLTLPSSLGVFFHVPLFLFFEGALHPTPRKVLLFCLFPITFIAFSCVKPTCTFFSKSPQNQTFLPFFLPIFLLYLWFLFFLPIELKFDSFFVICSIQQNPICFLQLNLIIPSSKLLIL